MNELKPLVDWLVWKTGLIGKNENTTSQLFNTGTVDEKSYVTHQQIFYIIFIQWRNRKNLTVEVDRTLFF